MKRPPIVGVAHIGLRTGDLAGARKFYSGVLGFQEPFTVDDPPGKLLLTYFKVNDHQYIEVFPELKDPRQTGFRYFFRNHRCGTDARLSCQSRRQSAGSWNPCWTEIAASMSSTRTVTTLSSCSSCRIFAQSQLRQIPARHTHLRTHHSPRCRCAGPGPRGCVL